MDNERKVILYFAGSILAVVFFMVGLIIFVPIPETGQEHAKYALAFMLGVASTIVSYFWGSSKGSADKSRATEEAAQVLAETAQLEKKEDYKDV